MGLKIGDRVVFKGEKIRGAYPQGKIVVVEKNRWDAITNYFVILDTGMYVQFKPHSLSWHKLDE